MSDKRRKIKYLDRVFQKRVLLVFLGWNFLVVLSNLFVYFFLLKSQVKDNLFRSHIKVSNVNAFISGEVLKLNLILAGISLVIVLIFYLIIRQRLKVFCCRLTLELQKRMDGSFKPSPPTSIPGIFAGIDSVLQDFFSGVDQRQQDEQEWLERLKASLE